MTYGNNYLHSLSLSLILMLNYHKSEKWSFSILAIRLVTNKTNNKYWRSAINPKQDNFVLSQWKFVLSQCKFVLSHFSGEKTSPGKANMANSWKTKN